MVDPMSVVGETAAGFKFIEQSFKLAAATKRFHDDFKEARPEHAMMVGETKNIGVVRYSIH